MATPNFLGLSTSGKPSVDWHTQEGDGPMHDADAQVTSSSGPLLSNLKTLPSDALGLAGAADGEDIPSNSGSVKNNMKSLPGDAFGTP